MQEVSREVEDCRFRRSWVSLDHYTYTPYRAITSLTSVILYYSSLTHETPVSVLSQPWSIAAYLYDLFKNSTVFGTRDNPLLLIV
jgi:hypothetical protein